MKRKIIRSAMTQLWHNSNSNQGVNRMEEEQQQQQQQLHRGVLDGIARLSDRRYRKERHKLIVNSNGQPHVDGRSLNHLVGFLDAPRAETVMAELELNDVHLPHPSDGGVNVLRNFFARSDTTLTKVTLFRCNFGSQEDASQLLATFERNRTVTDLTIRRIHNLEGATLGTCLSGLMQNMPQLQRLECSGALRVEGVRAFQPALQANRTLRELSLSWCDIRDEGIRLIADALSGNTTIEILDIKGNRITSGGLDDITRLLESTQLKSIYLAGNYGVFGNAASTQRFAGALSRHEFLKELHISRCHLGDEGIHLIVDDLVGNTIMDVLVISWNGITSVGLAAITRLLESTRLNKIDLGENYGVFDNEASTQRFARVLSRHEFLKELRLSSCQLGDGGIRIIWDGLVGNTIMEVLDINWNDITCVGLADITRLLESTQLKTITFWGNRGVFSDMDATQHFVSTLQQKNSSLQELTGISPDNFPESFRAASYAIISNCLTRNQQLNRVNLLLAPPQLPHQLGDNNGTATTTTTITTTTTTAYLIKVWHKAITKFAMVPNNAGASAIFKLFTARPQLLEKRLKRPTTCSTANTDVSEDRKRRRLEESKIVL